MQFTTSLKEFKELITNVSKVLPKRPTHSILEYLLIQTSEELAGFITVTGTSLQIFVELQCNADIVTPGAIAVPAKQLLAVLKNAKKGEISFTYIDKKLEVKVNEFIYHLQHELASDFVEIPKVNGTLQEISMPHFIEGIRRTVYAASSDETKQVLTGVHLNFSSDALEMSATDGHRIAQYSFESSNELSTVTIPATSLFLLEKFTKKSKDINLSLVVDSGLAEFKWIDGIMITRILEEEYPALNMLIPQQFSTLVKVNKQDLVDSAKSAMNLAEKEKSIEGKLLMMDLTESKLKVFPKNFKEIGGVQTLSCSLLGSIIQVNFTDKHFIEALENLPGLEILVNCNTPLGPVIISPAESTNSKYLALVMPVQKQD